MTLFQFFQGLKNNFPTTVKGQVKIEMHFIANKKKDLCYIDVS